MITHTDLERFYALFQKLEKSSRQGLPLYEYENGSCFPDRGVYFFCEQGEKKSSAPNIDRIVRIGTHAISENSKTTLWDRIRAHKGARNGNGNHRGSVFRRHIGAALLSRENVQIPTWGIGSTAPPSLKQDATARSIEAAWEKKVSDYIGNMRVFWIDVPGIPSSSNARAIIENHSIALLSNHRNPIDPGSPSWLGNFSDRAEIKQSGLWNINHIDQDYDPEFLALFELFVTKTITSA